MITFKIPLDETELVHAANSIDEESIDREKLKQMCAEFNDSLPGDKKALNQAVAEENGVSVEGLISGMNYEILCAEYKANLAQSLIDKLQKEFDLTEKQAWALFAAMIKTIG